MAHDLIRGNPTAVSRARTIPQSHGIVTLYRVIARLLALFLILSATVIFQTSTRAYAVVPALLVVPAAGALPLSVVSAGVSGGVFAISTGGAMASAAITAAAAFAGNWAVDSLFSWGADAPEDFGDQAAGVQWYENWSVNPYPMMESDAYNYTEPTWQDVPLTTVKADATGLTVRAGPFPLVHYAPGTTAAVVLFCRGVGVWNSSGGVAFTDGYAIWSYSGSCPGNEWGASISNQRAGDPASKMGYVTAEYVPPPVPEPVAPGAAPLSITPTTRCVDVNNIVQTFAGEIVKTTRSTSDPKVLSFPSCPSGSTLQSRSAPVTRDSDSAVLGDAVTGEITSTPGVWNPPAVPAEYPDCSNRLCVMTLTQTFPDGSTITCTQLGQCVSYSDVVKQYPEVGVSSSPVARQAPDGTSYQCKFGPYAVAVAECQVVPYAGIAAEVDSGVRDCLGTEITLYKPWTWVIGPVKCALSWAFIPSATAATAWQTRVADIKTRFPVNIMVGGVDVIGNVVSAIDGVNETPCDFSFNTPQGVAFDPMCKAGEYMQTDPKGQAIYRLANIAIIGGFGWWAWRRIAASFGGKEST